MKREIFPTKPVCSMSTTAFVGSAGRLFKYEKSITRLCGMRSTNSVSYRRQARCRKQWTPRAETETTESTSEADSPESTRVPELEALDPSSGSVVVRPTFNLAAAFLLTGGALDYVGGGWLVLGLPVTLIGLLLAVQSFRVRFVFGPTRLSVATRSGDGLSIIVGWKYALITNWEVWWKPLPILAYFKESESYNGRGSIHFFPIVCDGAQLIEQLRERVSHLDKTNYS